MNCRGDDDVDAKRSRPSIGKTRKVPREERARAFGWDPISESHQGQRPQRLHSKAGYMAAPERFAENVRFSLHCGRRPYMALFCRANRAEQCPVSGGDLNRSTQHLLILLDKEVADGDVTDIVHGEAEG